MKYIGIGDNVVDRYLNKKVMYPGGNAVNFAVYAKQCGVESAYLGVFADDKEGHLIRNALLDLGVDVSACPVLKDCATERCDVILEKGDRSFVSSGWEEGKEHKTLKLEEPQLVYLRNFHVIHSGCYADMEDEFYKLKEFQCIRTFDFSSEEEYRTDEYLEKVCPFVDMALFSGEKMSQSQVHILQEKVRALGTSYVLVTNGTKGQILFDGIAAHKGLVKLITPIDTMGAGDSFFASFVVYLMKKGWRRQCPLEREIIGEAFEYAAGFSSKNCLVEGSFGFASQYE